MADSVVLQVVSDDLLRVAVAAYLSRYKGLSRAHTASDLQVFLRWCADHQLDPLAMRRADVELFVRWLEEVRRFKPSTVSRRLSVVTCFYRTCVIDAVLEASPAAYVRRPPVPAESPTLGLSHLQFEAMIVAARTSTNPFDFALVAMLGLLGLRVFEACNAAIDDLGEEHGHRVLRVVGKGTKIVLIPLPPAVGRAIDRAVGDHAKAPVSAFVTSRSPHATPTLRPRCATTGPARTSTDTRTTSSPPSWPLEPDHSREPGWTNINHPVVPS
jgi:integrase/recombinase XerD